MTSESNWDHPSRDCADPNEALKRHCLAVADCEIARAVISKPLPWLSAVELRCAPLISSQLAAGNAPPAGKPRRWLLPEPWNGHLRKAPLLFIGQNPSANHEEIYPDNEWLDEPEALISFFQRRFGSEQEEAPIVDGTRVRLADGTYGRSVQFLGAVRRIAKDILGREPEPGVDYAITEAVRCKAAKASDIQSALDNCAQKHLQTTLQLSAARVIVLLGAPARQGFEVSTRYRVPGLGLPTKLGEWLVVALPHPSSRGDAAIKNLQVKDVEQLRRHVFAGAEVPLSCNQSDD